MKTKHIMMLALLMLAGMQLTAQNVRWMNPMDGDEPYISGRAWNKEMGKGYERIPARFEQQLPKGVWTLSHHTSGVIVRFVSTSRNIRVRFGCLDNNYYGFNMSGINRSGVDLYGKTPDGDIHWVANHMSWKTKPDTMMMEYRNLTFEKYKNRGIEYTLYLPNYNGIKWLEVGVDEGSQFQFLHQSAERPIVVYGSSIIQGASPSRPGMAITNIVERELGYPVVNLGFSGSARMEPGVFDMLSEIDARAFVLDPMPNSFNFKAPEIIKRAKEGVMKLRAKSKAPILLCECHPTPDSVLRSNIADKYNRGNAALYQAYKQLQAEGVKDLYYMSKDDIAFGEDYMIEGSHPNDLGCRVYADAYEKKIREMLPEDTPNPLFAPCTQRRDGCYEWPERHNQVIARNHTADPEILLIGNSITHFWGGYPECKINYGGKAWDKTFGKRRVTNMGFGWDRIENVYWRIFHGELEGCAPKHICLLIGINNYYTNKDEEIAQGIADLAGLIRERQPQAKLHVIKVYPARNREKRVAHINQLLEEKLKTDDKTELLDLGHDLLLKDGSGKINPDCFIKDGLHLNENGYTLVGKELKKHLK